MVISGSVLKSADHFEKSADVSDFNPQAAFELMLLDTTLGKIYLNLQGKDYVPMQSMFDDHRLRIQYALSNLPKFADQDGNYFIYAHVLSPHAPYVFGPNGEKRIGVDPYTLLDGVSTEPWKPEMYRDQVIYMNKLALNVIDEILRKSDPQPIIILQGDHSSRAYGNLQPTEEERMKLLYPILNAYYLPGMDASGTIPSSITPVNSFRLIFNHYFGTSLPAVEDASYIISAEDGRLKFVNICATHAICAQK